MSAKKLSKEFLKRAGQAAFKDDPKQFKELFLDLDADDIKSIIADGEKLSLFLKELARDESASFFKSLLDKFSDDEGCLAAVVAGFEADVKYHKSYNGDDRFDNRNFEDLKKKRQFLTQFITKQLKKEKTDPRPPRPRHQDYE